MQINYFQGTNFSSAPAWLTTTLFQVSAFYDKLFTNNITIDVTVNWVPLQWSETSTHEGGVLATNNLTDGTKGVTSSFSTVSNALISHEGNSIQTEAYGNMPTSGVSSVYVPPAEAMVLGLESNQTVNIDLNVNSSANWLGSAGFSPFDAFSAVAHEITETAMGRFSNPSSTPYVMDMFRFSGSGQHDLTTGTSSSNTTAYFSVDNGGTVLGTWNNKPNNGDYGDWSNGPVPDDAYGTQGGGVAPISEVDIELMNVLGWSVDVVTSGVTSRVAPGQTFSGYTVMAGGELVVSSGGTSSNTTYTDATAFNDGVLAPSSAGGVGAFGFIESNGYETSATVDGGGFEWVDGGGEALYTTVNAYGSVIDFGLAEDAVLSAHGQMDVEGGGSGYFNSVLSGGVLSVHTSGVGFGNKIENGGTEIVFGSSVLDNVSSGGTQIIEAGGSAAGLDTVLAGGTQIISSGGYDNVTLVDGTQDVYGVASGDIVSGGPANQYVEQGGSAVSANLEDVGYQVVLSGGYASATTVSATTEQIVESGGSARSTVVLSGGAAILYAGAIGDALTVSSGGVLDGPGVLIDSSTAAGTVNGVTVGDATHVDELELLSGGVANNVTVTIFADSLQVDSGASATGTVVMSNGKDVVYGSVTSTTVSATGAEYVSSGGEATATTVLSGGTENLASGAIGNGLTVSAGGVLNGPGVLIHHNTVAGTVSGVTVGDPYFVDSLELLSGGVANNVTVTIFADSLQVDSGASATGTVVSSGGTDIVLGSVTSTTVSNGGLEVVSSGGVARATVVSSGGIQTVFSGGVVSGTTVLGGGVDLAYVGAKLSAVTVSSGGVLELGGLIIGAGVTSSAGAVNATRVISGATLLSGGVVDFSKATVHSGGADVVQSGGAAFGTLVSSGGIQTVLSGGVVSGTTLSGGKEIVSSGGVARATVVSSGGIQTVFSGGVVSGTTVLGGGADLAYVGAKLSAVTVSSGGVLELGGLIIGAGVTSSAGAVNATRVISGATLLSGGVVDFSKATVHSGGADVVQSGGAAFGTLVSSGGIQTVLSGGVVSGTTLSGGKEIVSSGGVARATVVSSGGIQTVFSGGVVSGTTILGGGTDLAYVGAKLSAVTVSSGGVLELGGLIIGAGVTSSAGAVNATRVISGATLLSGGVVDFSKATVHSGGADVVQSGGAAFGTLVSSGGSETVQAGGLASGGVVTISGAEIVRSGGVVSALTISSGGSATVQSGGVTVGVTVTLGGTETVQSGGLGSKSVIKGVELVRSGGATRGDTISSGGAETLSLGAVASGTLVSSGATLTILSGAAARGLTLPLGGVVIDNGALVISGATPTTLAGTLSGSGTLVENGPGTLILSGADTGFAGGVVISGGVVELAKAGGVGSSSITFASSAVSATLLIETADQPAVGATFASTLDNFDQTYEGLDLRGLAYVSGATAVLSGSTLVLTDGGKVYNFKMGDTPGAAFTVKSDGLGGTLINDPHNTTLMVQAMAGFGAGAPGADGFFNGAAPTSALFSASALTATGSAGHA